MIIITKRKQILEYELWYMVYDYKSNFYYIIIHNQVETVSIIRNNL